MSEEKNNKKIIKFFRAVLEVAFIVFLFYSNLLMGEFMDNGLGQRYGFAWAINHIFTWINFSMAIILALIGYIVFECLRNIL